jgi:phage terminase large subunit GpA-like protein
MVSTALKKAFNDGLQAAIPDGGLTISKWAEKYRHVERSARPGKWSNDIVPFLTEIMDVITEPDIREVVFMKSSQVGGSELAVNTIGYFIHIDPTYIMYLGEQEDKAKAWTQESFDTTVSGTEVLSNLVKEDPSDNNQRIKRFPGGQLTIAWASSPAQLSSRPVQILICDEIDAYIVTREGNAIKLAEARQKTFSGSEKRVKISSPRDAGTSVIEPSYLAGDQREYYLPCPHCNEFQTLKWEHVIWPDGKPEEASYQCEVCELFIDHEEKADMLSKGRWIAGAETRSIASFKINELYSPFTTWADMAVDFLSAKKHRDTLKVFVNTRLGETWKDEETIEYGDLQLNKDDYIHPVPDGVLILTAGVDVQRDRLEYEIVGWGVGRENWSIDIGVLYGSPSLTDVWDDLAELLIQKFDGADRAFRIRSVCIDSGGENTEDVYKFCAKFKGRNWFPVKGLSTPGNPIASKGSKVGRPPVRLWTIGTDTAKDEVFDFLRIGDEGPGYCHFPNDDDRYGEEFLKQLCSEKKMSRFKMGREYHIYEKIKQGIRNEALDCRVYATAARAIILPKFDQWADREAKKTYRIKRVDDSPATATESIAEKSNTNEGVDVENAVEKVQNAKPRSRVRTKNNRFSGYRA